MDQFL